MFGSCIIHILYTGCAKIKKKFRILALSLRKGLLYLHCTTLISSLSKLFVCRTSSLYRSHFQSVEFVCVCCVSPSVWFKWSPFLLCEILVYGQIYHTEDATRGHVIKRIDEILSIVK